MSLSLDQAIGHEVALIRFSAARTSVLANNIANADTPHYKASDLDFNSVLQNTLKAGDQTSLAMTTTNAQHNAGISLSPEDKLVYRVDEQQTGLDGNTVDVQKEKMEFAKNAMLYQAGFSFLDGKLKQIVNALRSE